MYSIRQKALSDFHLMPLFLVLIQAPCYIAYFKFSETYSIYERLLNHIFLDSALFLVVIFLINSKWYLFNTSLFIGLCLTWFINLYILVWDLSLINYLYYIITVTYIVYVVLAVYVLTNINKK